MEVDFLTENLTEYLSLLGKIIPAHSQIPVLSSVMLEVTASDFVLSATDLEFGIRITTPCKIVGTGGVLVPGRQFVEILSSLTREKAKLKQEKDQVVLTAGSGSFKFQALPRDDFPRLYEEKGDKMGEYNPSQFQNIFSKLIFAVSQDESRPHLTGIYVVKKEGSTDYVATDGYRLSLKRVKDKIVTGETEGMILSPRLISEGLSLKGQNISLYVHKTGNQAILESGGALLVGRLIEGQYPDYDKVVPKELKTSIKLDREELLRLLKVTSVFARENANIINCNVTLGALHLQVDSSSLGEAESKIDGEQVGDDNHIAFNVKFLLDFLRSVDGKTVTLQISSPFEPALFTTDDDPDFFHVIMPVRVQE
ncbi:MAG: DNA polymerase III subunit beta [Candidatus Levybacteria bacterium]|nr:DNA polymerase III subunit beta [Candidatus Levybacteria bacterium]MBP9814707.1 DNA polymerase III subunit beta [Candidatus Levybacteria bacterium]